ncbi:helix-turn-helix domain-containing protein [Streptomyces sp. MUM 178J]|uniref:helix-turn-helix domain-containing protein n=1 Tax=Streptomyces sp. MUM 178J TaxID=2791991 RepID=UPI001F045D00|nr:helix-turn-helix transcriptional regulator [Streptomyces sp. MUM 178J]WRQ82047.1 helix-turn-helix transcriptional regulator [Streptomyces sp. MUM 178J]
MAGRHTRWVRDEERLDDPERIAIREAMLFGQAVYDRRAAIGLSRADLGDRLGLDEDEVERIELGGETPTLDLLKKIALALDADVRISPGGPFEPGMSATAIRFDAHAAA